MERGARSGAGGGRGGGGRVGAADLILPVRGRRPVPSMITGAVVGRLTSMSVETDPFARSGPDVGGRCLWRISFDNALNQYDRFTRVTMLVSLYPADRHCCSDDDANEKRRLLHVRW